MTPKAKFVLEQLHNDPRRLNDLAFDIGIIAGINKTAEDIPTTVAEVAACLEELKGYQRVKQEADGTWHWLPVKEEPKSKQVSLWD